MFFRRWIGHGWFVALFGKDPARPVRAPAQVVAQKEVLFGKTLFAATSSGTHSHDSSQLVGSHGRLDKRGNVWCMQWIYHFIFRTLTFIENPSNKSVSGLLEGSLHTFFQQHLTVVAINAFYFLPNTIFTTHTLSLDRLPPYGSFKALVE